MRRSNTDNRVFVVRVNIAVSSPIGRTNERHLRDFCRIDPTLVRIARIVVAAGCSKKELTHRVGRFTNERTTCLVRKDSVPNAALVDHSAHLTQFDAE
jgi:hypothetical protein